MNMGADTTRIWQYRPLNGFYDNKNTNCNVGSVSPFDPLLIILRHNPVTKIVQVTVGKKDLHPGDTQFKIGKGVLGRIVVVPPLNTSLGFLNRFSTFRYSCFAEDDSGDRALPENLELIKDTEDLIEDIKVQIPHVIVDGRKTVWYYVEAAFTQVYHGKTRRLRFLVHRRFRDFRLAYKQLASSYKNHHLRSSLPKHPRKEFALIQDHTDQEFLCERQRRLELWLLNVLFFPRAGNNPDILAFLGMGDPNFHEISVVVQHGQSLGLKMKKREGFRKSASNDDIPVELYPQAAVLAIVPGDNGRPGVAVGKVNPGDVITKVGGESVVNLSYEIVIDMIATLPRPLVVHFLTNVNCNTGEASESDNRVDDYSTDTKVLRPDHTDSDGNENTVQQRHVRHSINSEDQFIGQTADESIIHCDSAVSSPQPKTAPNLKPPRKPSVASLFARSKPKVMSEYVSNLKFPGEHSSNPDNQEEKLKPQTDEVIPANYLTENSKFDFHDFDKAGFVNGENLVAPAPATENHLFPSEEDSGSETQSQNNFLPAPFSDELIEDAQVPPEVPPRAMLPSPVFENRDVEEEESLDDAVENDLGSKLHQSDSDEIVYNDDDLEDVSF